MNDAPRALLLEAVKSAIDTSLCVIPPSPTGTKQPLPGGSPQWQKYQKQPPTAEELREWYADKSVTGIGIVCGHGGLECLDFDERSIFEEYEKAACSSGIGDLLERLKSDYYEHSPNGVHLLYRCQEGGGNTKLATRPKIPEEMKGQNDKTKTLIETRGEGGYIITAPSYGTVNPSGDYQLISGSFATIPTITPEERRALHELARTFNLLEDKELESERRQASTDSGKGGRPGDDFNKRSNWDDVLAVRGWTKVFTRSDTTYWRRPGKTSGISATTNHQGSDLLYVFSSSTQLEPNRGYSKFSTYAVLEHGGDFSAAALDLSRQGYGDATERGPLCTEDYPEPNEGERKPLFISANDMLTQPVEVRPLIGKTIERGLSGQIFGPSGSGKTFVVLDMACCVGTGKAWNGQQCQKGLVLYFAGEGFAGLRRRIKAWHRNNGYPDMSNIVISRSTVSFDNAGLRRVMAEAREIETVTENSVALVVVDTLARHLQGDENSTRDMSDFVRAVDNVRDSFPGSSIIIIHHTGHSTENGGRSRGSSALKAAMDFEIQCDKGLLTFTKLKDGDRPSPIEFKLMPTEIGIDEDGEPITSCVVAYGERSAKNREVSLTGTEKTILDIVATTPEILHADLRTAFFEKRKEHEPDAKYDTMKRAFNRAFGELTQKEQVHMEDLKVMPGPGQNRDIAGTCPTGLPGQPGHTPLGVSRCPTPCPVPKNDPEVFTSLSHLEDEKQEFSFQADELENFDIDVEVIGHAG